MSVSAATASCKAEKSPNLNKDRQKRKRTKRSRSGEKKGKGRKKAAGRGLNRSSRAKCSSSRFPCRVAPARLCSVRKKAHSIGQEERFDLPMDAPKFATTASAKL